MGKRGPKSDITIAGNRKHSIYLDETAERLVRLLNKVKKDKKWLNEFFSESIKKTYFKDFEKRLLKDEQDELFKTVEKTSKRLKKISKELGEYV